VSDDLIFTVFNAIISILYHSLPSHSFLPAGALAGVHSTPLHPKPLSSQVYFSPSTRSSSFPAPYILSEDPACSSFACFSLATKLTLIPSLDVNIPIESLEDAVISGIKANTPLFFGCDVGKFSDRTKGIMDTRLYDIKAAYGYSLNMTKAQRLIMGDSSATHAMVITAVHLGEDGRPVKYKVENSWSEASGEKGWYMMTADWFREFVYQVVVPRSVAEKRWVDVIDGEEVRELDPWDPMGALA